MSEQFALPEGVSALDIESQIRSAEARIERDAEAAIQEFSAIEEEDKIVRLPRLLTLWRSAHLQREFPAVYDRNLPLTGNLLLYVRDCVNAGAGRQSQQWWQEHVAEYARRWVERAASWNAIEEFSVATIRLAAGLQPPMDPARLTRFLSTGSLADLPDAITFAKEIGWRVEAGKANPQKAIRKNEMENRKSQSSDHRLRQPPEIAIAAYRLWFATGMKQVEIASILQKQTGRRITQAQVSRWLGRVQQYLHAGNILPDLPKTTSKTVSMDPSRIDLGERLDHRTKRQRPRSSGDE